MTELEQLLEQMSERLSGHPLYSQLKSQQWSPENQRLVDNTDLVRSAVFVLLGDLELAAAKFSESKTFAAHQSVIAVLGFLQNLGVRPHLDEPLEEVSLIVGAKLAHRRFMSREAEMNVYKSICVSVQVEDGIKLRTALKNVVGSDAEAAKKLKNFRDNMLGKKNTPKGAQELYFGVRHNLKGRPGPYVAAWCVAMWRIRNGKEGKVQPLGSGLRAAKKS